MLVRSPGFQSARTPVVSGRRVTTNHRVPLVLTRRCVRRRDYEKPRMRERPELPEISRARAENSFPVCVRVCVRTRNLHVLSRNPASNRCVNYSSPVLYGNSDSSYVCVYFFSNTGKIYVYIHTHIYIFYLYIIYICTHIYLPIYIYTQHTYLHTYILPVFEKKYICIHVYTRCIHIYWVK